MRSPTLQFVWLKRGGGGVVACEGDALAEAGVAGLMATPTFIPGDKSDAVAVLSGCEVCWAFVQQVGGRSCSTCARCYNNTVKEGRDVPAALMAATSAAGSDVASMWNVN